MKLDFLASYIVLWVLVLFQGLLVLALLRQLAQLQRLVERGGLLGEGWLSTGSQAPEFVGRDFRTGRHISSSDLEGRGGVLLFLSPECAICKQLANNLSLLTANGLPPVIVFCQGGEQACARLMKGLDLRVPLVCGDAEDIASRYGVQGSPTAVIVDRERKVRGYGHPANVEDLMRLLSNSLNESSGETNHTDHKERPDLAGLGPGAYQ